MKIEQSAGGVVVRGKKNGWEVLLLCDMSGAWTFPKGLIETGESKPEAAAREVGEEVGISDLNFLAELSPIQYWYRRNGLVQKKVYYFLFSSAGTQKLVPQTEEGVRKADWFPIQSALKEVGYGETNVPLLKEALRKLKSYGN